MRKYCTIGACFSAFLVESGRRYSALVENGEYPYFHSVSEMVILVVLLVLAPHASVSKHPLLAETKLKAICFVGLECKKPTTP